MAKKPRVPAESPLEWAFRGLLRIVGDEVPPPAQQYQFDKARRWRFDFAWPRQKVAVELDGGTRGRPVRCHNCGVNVRAVGRKGVGRELRLGGGHNRGDAYRGAIDKQNAAVLAGWRVLRVLERDLEERPVQMLEQLIALLKQAKT